MAGAGKKTFTAGETLTASDVNTYLMEQSVMVFGGTAARSSAIPTPSEGMTSYRTDTQQIESYDGAEWRGMSGLQLVKKQTIGSAVSSVAVTSAFSATYDNYKIIVSGGTASGATDLTLSLTGGTSVYSYGILYVAFGSSTPAAVTATNASSFVFAGNATGDTLDMNCDLKDPFNARYTTFKSQNASNTLSGASTAIHKSGSSFTGFTIAPAAGTLTGGTIYVYGYGV